jgi:hypothetical protein
MMNISTLFESELKKMIAEELERIGQKLLVGFSIEDMNQYKHETGRVAALRSVLDMCDEVNTIIANK